MCVGGVVTILILFCAKARSVTVCPLQGVGQDQEVGRLLFRQTPSPSPRPIVEFDFVSLCHKKDNNYNNKNNP